MSNVQSSSFSRKYSAPGGDYSSVQHGNISLELMKQTQNSKYLLSQGQDVGIKSTSSSVNLSDTSFSSGSSQNSGALPGQRGYHSNSSRGKEISCEFDVRKKNKGKMSVYYKIEDFAIRKIFTQ